MYGQLKPTDVFTPNRFPLEEHNVYAARADAEEKLNAAMARNQIPVVYGEYGVGKTTLIKKHFQAEEAAGRFVHVLNPANKNMDDVTKVVLEAMGYRVEVSRERPPAPPSKDLWRRASLPRSRQSSEAR